MAGDPSTVFAAQDDTADATVCRRGAGWKPALLLFLLLASPLHAELVRYDSGNPADVSYKRQGPVLILAGGGGDYAAAMQEAIDRVRGCTNCPQKVDVVVLRASGKDGYNPWFMEMRGVDSVTTLVITDRQSAEREDVIVATQNAELVFFAGGDQCNYIRWIKGTSTAKAVQSVYDRGGAVGGTSAGLAILSEVAYDACPSQSAKSEEVLRDPFHVDVSLSRGFFDFAPMKGTISDTHFVQRHRMGRLLVFLARSGLPRALGIGVSEGTVVLVDRKGRAKVHGDGPVHLILADRKAEVLEPGKPLTYRGYKVWKFDSGENFDLRQWSGGRFDRRGRSAAGAAAAPQETIDVIEGVVRTRPSAPRSHR